MRYRRSREGKIAVSFEGGEAEIDSDRCADFPISSSKRPGVRRRAIALWSGANLHLSTGGSSFVFSEAGSIHAADDLADGARITAPVAGLVLNVFAEPGQSVGAGQTLALIEAMKMETRVTAIHAGRVISRACSGGRAGCHASASLRDRKAGRARQCLRQSSPAP